MTDKHSGIISSQFFRLLPAQMLIPAIASVISIANGIIAGKFIEESAVGAVGLYAVMNRIVEAVGTIFLAGSAVMCGRSMGEGNLEKTKSLFSLNLFVVAVFGSVITLASLSLAPVLAVAFGAVDNLVSLLAAYIRGMAIGIIPFMLSYQLVSFLQLERKSRLTYVASGVMLVSNVGLAYLFVGILKLGIPGLAYATSAANWLYLFILGSYYLTKESQLGFSFRSIKFRYLCEMLTVGLPGALLYFTLAVQNLVVFRVALRCGGESALSAMSSYLMSANIVICYSLGCGNVVRNMASVSLGERDKNALHSLLDTVVKKAFPLSFAAVCVSLAVTAFFPGLFFDRGTLAYAYARRIFIIVPCFIPVLLFVFTINGYLQAKEHKVYSSAASLFDGLLSVNIPAVVLTYLFGTTGLWFAYPAGFVLNLVFALVYCCIYWRHIPRTKDEFLFLRQGFIDIPEKDRLECDIRTIEETVNMAEKVHAFCLEHGMDSSTAMHAELCLEEMVSNVVLHGFTKDNKSHIVQVRAIYSEDSLVLRIKDDCVHFNPIERVQKRNDSKDPLRNLGIRMVMKMAKEVTYQSLVGLNVLTIRL